MSWIFVIEENQGLFQQIKEAVSEIEPEISVLRFTNSKGFLDWMTGFTKNDPQLDPPVPKDKFLGIVTSVESWKFRDVQLIGKFKALFVQKKLSESEEELGVVFTGYEAEALHKKRYEHRSVNNFIYKPFDRLVLRQVLEIAFTGRNPVKKYFVHNLKVDTKIEMLKEIVSTGMTELGFRTVSDQVIEVGKISKYYAPFLETNQHRSALAQVLEFEKSAQNKLNSVYLRFFALDQQQSFNLQKLVLHKEAGDKRMKRLLSSRDTGAPESFEFIFLTHENSSLSQEIRPSIERFFDHPVCAVRSLTELTAHLVKPSVQNAPLRRFVFIDDLHVTQNEVAELQALHRCLAPQGAVDQSSGAEQRPVKAIPAASFFLLSPRIFPESSEFELSPLCEDIFYPPFNRSYIIKGLKQRWPTLKTKEDLFEADRVFEQTIHVSNPVKMVQVSEAGLVLEYQRPLPIGSFREFVFWLPNEVDVPNLLAQCNFTAPVEGKKTFHCHFIFFGLHDVQLKHIRLWMHHHYVEAKQKEQS